jgi:hypothetical protein
VSGIRVGSRLEQLRKLRDQVTVEIELEERRQRLDGRRPVPGAPASRRGGATTNHLLEQLGVTAKQVKEWGVEQGLIPTVVRGRVALSLVEAYASTRSEEAKG